MNVAMALYQSVTDIINVLVISNLSMFEDYLIVIIATKGEVK